jgi:hypothetical protein
LNNADIVSAGRALASDIKEKVREYGEQLFLVDDDFPPENAPIEAWADMGARLHRDLNTTDAAEVIDA